jgi:tRNA A37 threonylcarbamoyladenosine dehydratase
VGSHAAAALARSGCARIRLVDFDQVTLSSLNRHAVATLADVGLSKVLCLKRRLAAIAPWVGFDLRVEKFDKESADRLLGPWTVDAGDKGVGDAPAFVIDAIDNIDTKVELLRYCYEQKLPVISSMGAGLKSDPTRLTVGDIGLSTDDALSRAVRRRLKLLGITSGIPVVFSTEKGGEGKAELLPLPEHEFQRGKVGDLGVLPDFRVRILPVLGTMPAMFGLTVANYIILRIAGMLHTWLTRGQTTRWSTHHPTQDPRSTRACRQQCKAVRRRLSGGSPAGLPTPLSGSRSRSVHTTPLSWLTRFTLPGASYQAFTQGLPLFDGASRSMTSLSGSA